MTKRLTLIERAIQRLDDEIAALQHAKIKLLEQVAAQAKTSAKPKAE